MAKVDNLDELLRPVVEDLGYELLGIEYQANPKNRLVRVYVDHAENGIDVDDCAAVSREVSAILDVEDAIAGHYTLEVSSPGVERPLFNAGQFARFAGEDAVVFLHAPIDGRRKLKGRIVAGEGSTVVLDVEGKQWELDMADVRRAHLAPDLDALFAEGA